MPLEIKELVIRTSVDNQNTSNATASNENCSTPSSNETDEIQANEVLQMIKNRNER